MWKFWSGITIPLKQVNRLANILLQHCDVMNQLAKSMSSSLLRVKIPRFSFSRLEDFRKYSHHVPPSPCAFCRNVYEQEVRAHNQNHGGRSEGHYSRVGHAASPRAVRKPKSHKSKKAEQHGGNKYIPVLGYPVSTGFGRGGRSNINGWQRRREHNMAKETVLIAATKARAAAAAVAPRTDPRQHRRKR